MPNKLAHFAIEAEDEDGELDRGLVEEEIRRLSRAAQTKP